jgi:hypothetical protein
MANSPKDGLGCLDVLIAGAGRLVFLVGRFTVGRFFAMEDGASL